MSGSPKYTSAQLAAAREREIEVRKEERRLRREEEERAARMRRIEKHRAASRARLTEFAGRMEALAASAREAGFADRHEGFAGDLARAGAAVANANNESAQRTADVAIEAVDAGLQRLAVEVGGALARRRFESARAAIEAALAAEPERRELDPATADRVDALMSRATASLTDEERRPAVHHELGKAADEHLAAVRTRRQELAEMRAAASIAVEGMDRLLAEVDAIGATVDGSEDARCAVDELNTVAAEGRVSEARALSERVGGLAAALDERFERWLVEQDRTALIIDAMREALPAAGLSVVDGSFTTDGSGGRFVAHDATRRTVEIAIEHDDAGTRIVYHADGRDFDVEHTVDGDVGRCDLTQELLEKFHGELAKQDVETGELMWQDKPRGRPDRVARRALPDSRHRPGPV